MKHSFRGKRASGSGFKKIRRRFISYFLNRPFDFGAEVVVVDLHGNFLRLGKALQIALGLFEEGDGGGGVVADDGALCAVKDSAHGVVPAAADGYEDLTDHVVRELEDRNDGVVGLDVLEELVRTVSKYLLGIACVPTEQVDGVAAATDHAVTERILTPLPKELSVVVCILGLNEEKVTDNACFKHFLCLYKSGSVATNLANHKLNAGLTRNANHFLAFLKVESHGLLAENVLACSECITSYNAVLLIGKGKGNCIDVITSKKLLIIGAILSYTIFRCSKLCFFNVNVANNNCFGML